MQEWKIIPARPPIARYQLQQAEGQVSPYLDYLPGLFTESEFLGRYLMIFQSIWEPLQHCQDHMELYFSASTAPGNMLG